MGVERKGVAVILTPENMVQDDLDVHLARGDTLYVNNYIWRTTKAAGLNTDYAISQNVDAQHNTAATSDIPVAVLGLQLTGEQCSRKGKAVETDNVSAAKKVVDGIKKRVKLKGTGTKQAVMMYMKVKPTD